MPRRDSFGRVTARRRTREPRRESSGRESGVIQTRSTRRHEAVNIPRKPSREEEGARAVGGEGRGGKGGAAEGKREGALGR